MKLSDCCYSSWSSLLSWWNHRDCNCMNRDWESCNCIKRFFILSFTLKGYVPSNLYTTDFRLVFVLTAIYTSLVSQFRQAGIQEAEEDIVSGRLFRINSVWTNHSVTGGVSDRILWNCRSDSETSTYYKTFYLGLIAFCCVVIIVYFVSSMIINAMVAYAVSKINFYSRSGNRNKVHYLEVVANEIKKTLRLRKKIKELKNKWIVEVEKQKLMNKIKEVVTKWQTRQHKFENNKHLYNWFTVLYIIPRIETAIMLCILTFALTSYDIHPIGCLSPIDVTYNEEDSSVILKISEHVIRYQMGSAILIILLFILWFFVKLFQFSLLPRYHWGIRIEKLVHKRWCCWPWKFSIVRGDSQDDPEDDLLLSDSEALAEPREFAEHVGRQDSYNVLYSEINEEEKATH